MADLDALSVADLAELVAADAELIAAFDREYRGSEGSRVALERALAADAAPAPSLELLELRGLAFGRPDLSHPDRHLRAQRKLDDLNAEHEAASVELKRALVAVLAPPEDPVMSEPARSWRGSLGVLTLVLVVLVGATLAALLAPVSSLAVFDRAQTADEVAAAHDLRPFIDFQEPNLDSLRLLEEDDGVVFLAVQIEAMQTIDGLEPGVCLYMVGHGGAGAACSTMEQARVAGISGRSGPYSFSWGPTGPLALTGGTDDAPAGR